MTTEPTIDEEQEAALERLRLEDEEARATIERASRSPRARITLKGRFRLYFNRAGAAPLVWCVAPEDGEFEIAVKAFELRCDSESVYRQKEEDDDEDGRPSAWIACTGELEIEDGIARISP